MTLAEAIAAAEFDLEDCIRRAQRAARKGTTTDDLEKVGKWYAIELVWNAQSDALERTLERLREVDP